MATVHPGMETRLVKRIKIHKGGRPKSNRSEKDYGTAELIAKRAFIAQGDPTLSTCPLDALLSRGFISTEAHTAAVHFRSCRQIVFGSPHPQAVDLNLISGSGAEYDEERAEAQYRDACSALKSISRRLFDIIDNIVIHERFPAWFSTPGRGDQWDRARTGHAFGVLLAWYTGRQRKAA